MPYGNRLWTKPSEVTFKELKQQTIRILARETALHGGLSLQALKELLRKETGGSPKQIQINLKMILDKLCEGEYYKTRSGRFVVIRRRGEEKRQAA